MDYQEKSVVDAILNVIDRSVQSMKDIAATYDIDSTSYVRITNEAINAVRDMEQKIANKTDSQKEVNDHE